MIEFYRPKNLLSNFVLVNGTARCGKSMISPIIASFENVEIERMEGIFDFISVSYYFGKIERNCAISMLRTLADELFMQVICLETPISDGVIIQVYLEVLIA